MIDITAFLVSQVAGISFMQPLLLLCSNATIGFEGGDNDENTLADV